MKQADVKVPQLKSAVQLGGCYVQVFPFGRWVVASRIGGIQVFRDDDRLLPVNECALAVVPHIHESRGSLFLVCRTKTFEICISSQGRISLKATRPLVDILAEKSEKYAYELNTRFGQFLIDKSSGEIETPGKVRLRLPGYSRPSWISCDEARGIVYVADVGMIHRLIFRNGNWVLDGGYECAGWPKDISCIGDNVFVANVLGVSWFKRIIGYPYLRLQDRISRFHFRVAKVVATASEVFVCDEARGVHVFSIDDGRLKACGGVFVPGGGWDILPCGQSCYLASGTGGWRWYEDIQTVIKGGHSKAEHHLSITGERVQGIANWPQTDSVVVMTSSACRLVKEHSDDILFEHRCNAWAGVAVENHLIVATESGLILLYWNLVHRRIELADFIPLEEARDVCWDGSFFWIAAGRQGIRCFSLDDNENKLHFIGCFPVCGFARGVYRTKDRVYVGAGDGGLVVLKS